MRNSTIVTQLKLAALCKGVMPVQKYKTKYSSNHVRICRGQRMPSVSFMRRARVASVGFALNMARTTSNVPCEAARCLWKNGQLLS